MLVDWMKAFFKDYDQQHQYGFVGTKFFNSENYESEAISNRNQSNHRIVGYNFG